MDRTAKGRRKNHLIAIYCNVRRRFGVDKKLLEEEDSKDGDSERDQLAVSKEILSRGVKVAAQMYRGRGNGVSDLLVARPPWSIKAPCCFGS